MPPSTPPKPAPGQPVQALPRLAEGLAKRLRLALNVISPTLDSGARNVMDLYYNFINPNPHLVDDGSSNFPRRPNFHPVNKERFVLPQPNKVNLLIAHFGAAVLGVYDVASEQYRMADKRTPWTGTFKDYEALAAEREKRVYLIEQIAKRGLGGVRVDGDASRGYTLIAPTTKVNGTPSVTPESPVREEDEEDDDEV